MKITKQELTQIIKEELEAEMNDGYGETYSDDVNTPSLQSQMSDAILAAVEAMDAGDLEAARAAFSEELLKNLRPYTGPVGKGASAAEMEDYESDYRSKPEDLEFIEKLRQDIEKDKKRKPKRSSVDMSGYDI